MGLRTTLFRQGIFICNKIDKFPILIGLFYYYRRLAVPPRDAGATSCTRPATPHAGLIAVAPSRSGETEYGSQTFARSVMRRGPY